jgi:divalent metal cation (Fe/Co/Zn/Cd) transporter
MDYQNRGRKSKLFAQISCRTGLGQASSGTGRLFRQAPFCYTGGMQDPNRTGGNTAGLFRWAVGLEWFTVAWNVLEAAVAIGAGIMASSTALIAFGSDSLIELISAVAVLWRLLRAGPTASEAEHTAAERRALYLVAITFFLLAAYVAVECTVSLLNRETADASTAGFILAVASLIVMPMLAYAKRRIGKQLGSKALQADAVETWVCSFLSLTLLLGVGFNAAFGWWWSDAVGAIAMLPVIVWQGWETLEEARER